MPAMLLLAAALQPTPAPAVAPPPSPGPVASAPAPLDPQRLTLARAAAAAMLPPGALGRMMTAMDGGGGLFGTFLDLNPAELIGAPAKPGAPGEGATLRQSLARSDPYFDQRMRITMRVMGEEFARLSPQLEPPLREGMAEALARRFTEAQLTSLNRFFATPDGQAFAGEFLTLWIDPAFIRSYFKAMPVLIRAMPEIMKKVEVETAGLPKPKPVKVTLPPDPGKNPAPAKP